MANKSIPKLIPEYNDPEPKFRYTNNTVEDFAKQVSNRAFQLLYCLAAVSAITG